MGSLPSPALPSRLGACLLACVHPCLPAGASSSAARPEHSHCSPDCPKGEGEAPPKGLEEAAPNPPNAGAEAAPNAGALAAPKPPNAGVLAAPKAGAAVAPKPGLLAAPNPGLLAGAPKGEEAAAPKVVVLPNAPPAGEAAPVLPLQPSCRKAGRGERGGSTVHQACARRGALAVGKPGSMAQHAPNRHAAMRCCAEHRAALCCRPAPLPAVHHHPHRHTCQSSQRSSSTLFPAYSGMQEMELKNTTAGGWRRRRSRAGGRDGTGGSRQSE